MKLPIIIVMAAAGTAAAQAKAPAEQRAPAPLHIRHVPPGDVETGKAVELIAEAPATTPTLVAHVRAHGTTVYKAIELVRRDDAHWVAVVPADIVAPPSLDYYIVAGDQPAFASPDWPHTFTVRAAPEEERRGRDLMRLQSRRSKVNTMGEWVEYGKRRYGDERIEDHYYRLEGDFSYRLLVYPLEEIRVGGTYMLGTTLAGPDQMCTPGVTTCSANAGIKAGWFELGLAAVEGIRLDARMIAMATADGFNVGARGEARLGAREASHVAVGAEYLADTGASGFFRLGWGTVPKLPMAATVEVTNLPASHRETGVRLFYDIAREVAPGFRLGLRVGYAARTQSVAGFTGGAGASVEF